MCNTADFILLDSDVIVHFYRGEQLLLLKQLYDKRLLVLDRIVQELKGLPAAREIISNFINYKIADEIIFPNEPEIIKEYARLIKSGRGKGESACMAYIRYKGNILASSNLKDVKDYC